MVGKPENDFPAFFLVRLEKVAYIGSIRQLERKMNHEEKHKEDLEAANGWLAIAKENDNKLAIQILEDFFPELKESEDERIRKEIIETIKWIKEGRFPTAVQIKKSNSWLAWLEKQREQNTIVNESPSKEIILAVWELGNIWKELTKGSSCTEYGTQLQFIQKHWNESDYYEKLQGEQKPKEKTIFYDSMDDLIADAMIDETNKSNLLDRDKYNRIYWINSHRKKNFEWSEEDERMYQSIIDDTVQENQLDSYQIAWLKSLKPRSNLYDKGYKDGYSAARYNHWKPSEFQLKCLEKVIPHNNTEKDCELEDVLTELYNDLKNL